MVMASEPEKMPERLLEKVIGICRFFKPLFDKHENRKNPVAKLKRVTAPTTKPKEIERCDL